MAVVVCRLLPRLQLGWQGLERAVLPAAAPSQGWLRACRAPAVAGSLLQAAAGLPCSSSMLERTWLRVTGDQQQHRVPQEYVLLSTWEYALLSPQYHVRGYVCA